MPDSTATLILPRTAVYGVLANLSIALLFLFGATQHAAAQSEFRDSVSQYGITWHFGETRETGRYANGDWWVVGPVTITSITPESQVVGGRTFNGTQVNPSFGHHRAEQGYDSATSHMNYVSALNMAPSYTGQPLALNTGSVVSSISKPTEELETNHPRLDDVAILTVVSEPPPQGAFRPHPYGEDKTSYWVESDLDYSILQSLSPVGSPPNLAERSARHLRFWNEQPAGSWQQRDLQASNNQEFYGRRIANYVGESLLLLHLDYTNAQKRDLFVGLVQYGLDNYGRILQGERWWADGAHNHGRKMQTILAGLALNDPNILAAVDGQNHTGRFQEDSQTFYVTQEDVDRELEGDREPYTSDMIGMPEWGIRHFSRPQYDNSSWGATYRYAGSGFVAHGLAARLTSGAVDAWNWPAFFDYIDRFQSLGGTDSVGSTNGVTSFVQAMWDAYRQLDPDLRRPVPPEWLPME